MKVERSSIHQSGARAVAPYEGMGSIARTVPVAR
jgi:hypothetical protein